MPSKKIPKTLTPKEAFVWIWLPGEVDPVVAGKLSVRLTHGDERF